MKSLGPCFSFYHDDYLGGTNHFTDRQHGAYLLLLIEQWRSGFLLDDSSELRSIARTTLRNDDRKWLQVLAKFPVCSDGYRRNSRMDVIRCERIAFLERQAAAGKASAAKRAATTVEPPLNNHSNHRSTGGVTGGVTGRQPEGNPPSPPPSPPPPDIQKEEKLPLDDKAMMAALAVASKLATTIHSWKPNFGEVQPSKINRTLTRWAKDIDLAIRLEKRTVQDLEAVIEWLPTHEGKDGFRWREQILSGAKLREKFDRLEIAMRNGGSNGERRVAGRRLYTAEEVGAHMEEISR